RWPRSFEQIFRFVKWIVGQKIAYSGHSPLNPTGCSVATRTPIPAGRMNIESQGHSVVLSQAERFRRIVATQFAVLGTLFGAGAGYFSYQLLNRPQPLSAYDLLHGALMLACGLFAVSQLWFLPRTAAVIDTRSGEICISHVAPLRQRHACYALTDI